MQMAYDFTLYYSYTSFKYILDDMMLIRSFPEKTGHDLRFEN